MFFRFETPFFLLLLPLLPLLARARHRKEGTGAVAMPHAVADVPQSWGMRAFRMLPWTRLAALALLIVALARPQWGERQRDVFTEGINIVLAVDLSQTMAALDFEVEGERATRLDAVKNVLADFIPRRRDDRIALVVFGSHAYTQVPLTNDTTLLLDVLDRLEIGAAGPNTALGDAVGIALKRLKDVPSVSNVVVLLTDGQSNTGEFSPEASSRMAAELGVRLYSIAVGTRGKAPYLVDDPLFGRRLVYRDVDIDERTLERMAQETGGLSFRATDTEGLRKIYDTIDRLEKSKKEVKVYDAAYDIYPWLLPGALALLLSEQILAATRCVRVP